MVPIEKEVNIIDENWEEITKTISCRLQFIDSPKFMASSLSNLVNNLSQGIHKIKCKNCIKRISKLQRWFSRTQMLMLQ